MDEMVRKAVPAEIDENWHFDVGAECAECGSIGLWIDEDMEHEFCDRCG